MPETMTRVLSLMERCWLTDRALKIVITYVRDRLAQADFFCPKMQRVAILRTRTLKPRCALCKTDMTDQNPNPYIEVPYISTQLFMQPAATPAFLADCLLKEYARALAELYPGLIKTRPFTVVFGAPYVTPDAAYCADGEADKVPATAAADEFAEYFATFVCLASGDRVTAAVPIDKNKIVFLVGVRNKIHSGSHFWA